MSAPLSDTGKRSDQRPGAAALLAVGGGISALLVLCVCILGHTESQPYPDIGFEARPYPYVALTAVWAAAAAAEFFAAATCRRWPRSAVVIVAVAVVAGFAVIPTITPTRPIAGLAWLAPLVPLSIGAVTLLRASTASNTRGVA